MGKKKLGESYRDQKSFGPAVIHTDGEQLRATCKYCAFKNSRYDYEAKTWSHLCDYSGGSSRKGVYQKERLSIPDPENTPSFCEMLKDIMQEAQKMAAGE